MTILLYFVIVTSLSLKVETRFSWIIQLYYITIWTKQKTYNIWHF